MSNELLEKLSTWVEAGKKEAEKKPEFVIYFNGACSDIKDETELEEVTKALSTETGELLIYEFKCKIELNKRILKLYLKSWSMAYSAIDVSILSIYLEPSGQASISIVVLNNVIVSMNKIGVESAKVHYTFLGNRDLVFSVFLLYLDKAILLKLLQHLVCHLVVRFYLKGNLNLRDARNTLLKYLIQHLSDVALVNVNLQLFSKAVQCKARV